MWAQIFLVTSLRGSGSEPTTLARCSDGCIGFIKALPLSVFALPPVFGISLPQQTIKPLRSNCNGPARRIYMIRTVLTFANLRTLPEFGVVGFPRRIPQPR